MTRLAIIIAILAGILVGGVYIGMRWDDARKEATKSDTLERISDADISKGDVAKDDSWNRDFIDGLLTR